jgi:hypothetical protein
MHDLRTKYSAVVHYLNTLTEPASCISKKWNKSTLGRWFSMTKANGSQKGATCRLVTSIFFNIPFHTMPTRSLWMKHPALSCDTPRRGWSRKGRILHKHYRSVDAWCMVLLAVDREGELIAHEITKTSISTHSHVSLGVFFRPYCWTCLALHKTAIR